jgi:hypothetical protein
VRRGNVLRSPSCDRWSDESRWENSECDSGSRKDLAPGASVIWIPARPRRHHGRCIAREKECDRAGGQRPRWRLPAPHVGSTSHRARSARATLANARSWPVGRPNARLVQMRPAAAWLRALPRARAACRARVALRIAGERAAQHSRALGGHGSSRPPHVSRPALARAAGRCTVRRQHRSCRIKRHASPTRRRAAAARARAFIASGLRS